MRYYLALIVAIAYLAYVSSDACVQCNSSTDSKCATNPEAFLAKECSNSTSKCYTRVLNGNTIRGCAIELDNSTASTCNNENECLICSFTEGCNRQVFPTHRASCIQCAGNSTGTCAMDIFAKPTYCPIYELGDRCYIRVDNKNTTSSFQRGCLSSAKGINLCTNLSNCYVCDGAGCNFLDSNSTEIPLARDSSTTLGYSIVLILAAGMSFRFL